MTSDDERISSNHRKIPQSVLRAVWVVVVLGVTGLLLEGGAYLVLRIKDRPRDVSYGKHLTSVYRSHRLNPDYRYRLPDGSAIRLHSPDGFRESAPVAKEKPENTYRIIVLGGSTLYGAGGGNPYPHHPVLLNTQTIDHNMEEVLNARLENNGRSVEVVNAGLTAYQTFQHLIHINERLLQYDADLLVFLDGHNDFYKTDPQYSHWEDYAYGPWLAVQNMDDPSFLFTVLIGARYFGRVSNFGYLVHEAIFRVWRRRLNEYAASARGDGQISLRELRAEYPQIAHNSYLRAYRQIKSIADYEGMGMMVFLQPEIVLEHADSMSSADRQLQEITLRHQGPGRAEQMKEIHRMIPPLFGELGVDFQDLAVIARTSGSEQLYTDYCHLTPAGAALVGRKMADAVWPRVREWATGGSERWAHGGVE